MSINNFMAQPTVPEKLGRMAPLIVAGVTNIIDTVLRLRLKKKQSFGVRTQSIFRRKQERWKP